VGRLGGKVCLRRHVQQPLLCYNASTVLQCYRLTGAAGKWHPWLDAVVCCWCVLQPLLSSLPGRGTKRGSLTMQRGPASHTSSVTALLSRGACVHKICEGGMRGGA
jgi:hypothetical protein